jgi:preprotein translocase subunit SecG
MISFLYFTAIFFFMLLCILTCFIVMIQESKSTGLGASFGGDASESIFGTSTADVLKQFTAWLGVIFLASCLILSLWTSAMGRSSTSTITQPASSIEQE